jgi:hypothetical protein
MIYFELQGLPSTTNSSGRKHWAIKAREARHWKQAVAIALLDCIRSNKPFQKARGTFTRCSSSECDFDGLVSSFKSTIDGLVSAGVLINDKPSNLDALYLWKAGKPKHGYITVMVEEII